MVEQIIEGVMAATLITLLFHILLFFLSLLPEVTSHFWEVHLPKMRISGQVREKGQSAVDILK